MVVVTGLSVVVTDMFEAVMRSWRICLLIREEVVTRIAVVRWWALPESQCVSAWEKEVDGNGDTGILILERSDLLLQLATNAQNSFDHGQTRIVVVPSPWSRKDETRFLGFEPCAQVETRMTAPLKCCT